jgi:hypothetical protein
LLVTIDGAVGGNALVVEVPTSGPEAAEPGFAPQIAKSISADGVLALGPFGVAVVTELSFGVSAAVGWAAAGPPYVLVPAFNSSTHRMDLVTSKIPNAGGPGAPHGGANGYQALVTNGAGLFRVWPPYGGVTGSDGCDKRVRPSVTASQHGCRWATNGGPFDMVSFGFPFAALLCFIGSASSSPATQDTGKCNAGMFVSDGKIYGTGGWPPGFGVTAKGEWIIGSVNATVVQQLGIRHFLTGFSWLVRDGQNVAGAGSFTAPRTTIGTDGQGRLLSLEVDGCEGCHVARGETVIK